MAGPFSPVDVLSIQQQQRLIEAGAARPEDFVGGRTAAQPQVAPPVGGSSGQADLAKHLGITVQQLQALQDAKKLEMMRKQEAMARKLKGYASGGQVNPMEHQFSSNSADYMRDRVSPSDIAKGAKHWGKDLLALPGDALDAVAYALRKIGRGQSEASVPSLGAGAALRRLMTQSKPQTEASMSDPTASNTEEAVRMLNPLMMGNPAKLVKSPLALAALAGLTGDATMAAPMMAGVIKGKGGQWLNGSVENILKGELRSPLYMIGDPEMAAAGALDNWIKGPLTKHIKRDMGTANDPFVRLADQGIQVNEAPYTAEVGGSLKVKRSKQNQSPYGTAQTEAGKAWENTNDTLVNIGNAGDLSRSAYKPMLEDNKWLSSAAPATPVYSTSENILYEGGISHMLDELANAIGPDSGLPAHLQLHPDQLKSGNFSVDAAIRRVNDINKWRADTTTAANQARANNAATVLHKEYPEKGMKWVQLKNPEIADDKIIKVGRDGGAAVVQANGTERYFNSVDEAKKFIGKGQLRDALKYEGDTMGHCVGGYCDDVESGRSKIYSLRDAKGQPHVTIETAPRKVYNEEPYKEALGLSDDDFSKLRAEWGANPTSGQGFYDWLQTKYPNATPDTIVQIKGKGNKKPIDEYLPFVQDFVKSGQWSDVGDIGNADMWKHPKTGQYHTKAEALSDETLGDVYDSRNLDAYGNYRPGFAQGGLIDIHELHGY